LSPLPPPSGFFATCCEGLGAGLADGLTEGLETGGCTEPRGLIVEPRVTTEGDGFTAGLESGLDEGREAI